ncbi:hypothetical protein AGLY_002408 [Aphis glycines]|uniref:Uncharacterized protein n=1 Tax=Aphis glycines TaxID=307491 RepID=A0A6G0U3B5_APHGL|nr:hypothetical protein AGLY_002408 [Aphis glycines]
MIDIAQQNSYSFLYIYIFVHICKYFGIIKIKKKLLCVKLIFYIENNMIGVFIFKINYKQSIFTIINTKAHITLYMLTSFLMKHLKCYFRAYNINKILTIVLLSINNKNKNKIKQTKTKQKQKIKKKLSSIEPPLFTLDIEPGDVTKVMSVVLLVIILSISSLSSSSSSEPSSLSLSDIISLNVVLSVALTVVLATFANVVTVTFNISAARNRVNSFLCNLANTSAGPCSNQKSRTLLTVGLGSSTLSVSTTCCISVGKTLLVNLSDDTSTVNNIVVVLMSSYCPQLWAALIFSKMSELPECNECVIIKQQILIIIKTNGNISEHRPKEKRFVYPFPGTSASAPPSPKNQQCQWSGGENLDVQQSVPMSTASVVRFVHREIGLKIGDNGSI